MSESLLQNLSDEVNSFLDDTKHYGNDLFSQIEEIEEKLELKNNIDKEKEVTIDMIKNIEEVVNLWSDSSVELVRNYMKRIIKAQKKIFKENRFKVDLNEAYMYSLELSETPLNSEIVEKLEESTKGNEENNNMINNKKSNEIELYKTIIDSFVKIGKYVEISELSEILESCGENIDTSISKEFMELNHFSEQIMIKHNLKDVLEWFENQNKIIKEDNKKRTQFKLRFERLEFKFHLFQFILLIHDDFYVNSKNNCFSSFFYFKKALLKFYNKYLNEISSILPLLCLGKTSDVSTDKFNFFNKKDINILISMVKEDVLKKNTNEFTFIYDLLNNFEKIHDLDSLFSNICNEFISNYCEYLNLSKDPSLFQVLFSGFLNLPNFYKYNKIKNHLNQSQKLLIDDHTDTKNVSQKHTLNEKINSIVVPSYNFEIPFSLNDTFKFLFNFHPIFVCPISKEQLEANTNYNDLNHFDLKKKKHTNTVVALNFCQHLALKDSIWLLSKNGSETFKCHYCYKKHKFTDITSVYFIDL